MVVSRAVVAFSVLFSLGSGAADGTETLVGRWARVIDDHPSAAMKETELFEVSKCTATRQMCGRIVLPDGSCGVTVIDIASTGDGSAEGSYLYPYPVPDLSLDQRYSDRVHQIRLTLDEDILTIEVQPSPLWTMLSRSSLDASVVRYRRIGAPSCEPIA